MVGNLAVGGEMVKKREKHDRRIIVGHLCHLILFALENNFMETDARSGSSHFVTLRQQAQDKEPI